MNKTYRVILDVIWYLILFVLLQLLVTYAVNTVALLFNNMPFGAAIKYAATHPILSSTTLIVSSAISSALTILVFVLFKFTLVSKSYLRSKPWASLFWVVLLALGTILPSTWLMEQMEIEVPTAVERMLTALMGDRWGYLTVGILVPIAEELVFRGAILRSLQKVFTNRWIAICLSAVVFALVHGNMAQLPHAFIMGILLGWLFVRTNSIIPGVVLHWVNNSVVFVMYNLLPNSANEHLIDLFGGNQRAVWMSLLFSLCILLPSLFQLTVRLKKAKE